MIEFAVARPAQELPAPSPGRYLAARATTRLRLHLGPKLLRDLEDHVSRILPGGYAPQEIRRMALAGAMYSRMAELDSKHRRTLHLAGAPLPATPVALLSLFTPFHARLGWHRVLAPHRLVALVPPREPGSAAFAEEALALAAGAPLMLARYERRSVAEEALHLTPLASTDAADLLRRLGDMLNLNPAYYHWEWSLERAREQSP